MTKAIRYSETGWPEMLHWEEIDVGDPAPGQVRIDRAAAMSKHGSMTLNGDEMLSHAREWIAAWNRRDLAAVLLPFDENASFRSPYAQAVVGSTVLSGKAALETYWTKALQRIAKLEFELLSVVCDVDAQVMVVHYLASLDGPPRRACELFRFERGRKVYAEALYGGGHAAAA